MAAPPTVGRFRTEGGAEIELDLPLGPLFADQLRRGELVSLDADGHDTVAVPRPARTDPKGRWEEYAVARGATVAQAKAAPKAELIERYGTDQ